MSFYRAAGSTPNKIYAGPSPAKESVLEHGSPDTRMKRRTRRTEKYLKKFIYLDDEDKTELQSMQGNQEAGSQNERGDLQFALKHQRANKVGSEDKTMAPFFCTCCMKNAHKVDFEMGCNIEDLAEVDIGYVLYFKFLGNVK